MDLTSERKEEQRKLKDEKIQILEKENRGTGQPFLPCHLLLHHDPYN